jgi:hypothetical protein
VFIVNSILNSLPSFTIKKIDIVNSQTQKIHKINNPKPSIVLPHIPNHQSEQPPSILKALKGKLISLAGQIGMNIPNGVSHYVTLKCSGTFQNFKELQKTKVGWIVYIYLDQNTIIRGRFIEVNSGTGSGAIITSNYFSRSLFNFGSTYPLLDGYWGERVKIVLDASRKWKRVKFKPRDGIMHYNDGRVEEIKGGWDHEHCKICWQTISAFEDEENFGYVDQADIWLCQSCYKKYKIPKSITFVNLNQVF